MTTWTFIFSAPLRCSLIGGDCASRVSESIVLSYLNGRSRSVRVLEPRALDGPAVDHERACSDFATPRNFGPLDRTPPSSPYIYAACHIIESFARCPTPPKRLPRSIGGLLAKTQHERQLKDHHLRVSRSSSIDGSHVVAFREIHPAAAL
jgi:hypothetical protein